MSMSSMMYTEKPSEQFLTKSNKLHCDYRTFLKLFGDYHSKVFTNYLNKIKNDEGLIYYDTYYNDEEDETLFKMKLTAFTWKLDLDLSNISIVPEHIIVEDIKVKRKYIKKLISCEDN